MTKKEIRNRARNMLNLTDKMLEGLFTIVDDAELLESYRRNCREQNIEDNPHDIIVYFLGMNNATRKILDKEAHSRTHQYFDEDIDLGD